eukprot:scaffold47215_cov51-Attheya_sp.AAC.6
MTLEQRITNMLKVLATDDIVRLLRDSPVLIIICSILLATLAAVFFARRSKTTPPPWPVVAGARPFIGNSMESLESLGAQLDIWAKRYDNEKGIFEFQLFGTRFIVPCRAETLELIMNERPFQIQRNSKLNDAIASVGGDGLFSAEGETWKSDRRLVAPALNRKNVEDYLSMINMVTGRLVKKWESETVQGGRHVVVNRDVLSMTMDIISLVAFGKDMDFLRAQGSVGPDLLKLMNVTMIRSFSPFPYWNIPWIGQYLDGAAWPKHRLLHYFSSLVKQHESLAEEASAAASKDNHKSRTFLSKVLRSGNTSMSHDRLVGNLFTLFAAGSETTHVTICSCLWEIATDTTGLQDELASEAQRMKNMEKASVEELLNGFPRIRSLMYEILRLKGPVPFFGFQCKDEFSICGTKLPPSTKLMVPTRYISMQSGQTPSGPLNASASEFCARRYLLVDRGECQSTTADTISTKEKKLSVMRPCDKTGFNTFGNGKRVCPGRDLAEMEVIICLASVLRKFVVTLKEEHPPMKLVTRFTESPNINIMLSLQPRGRMHTSSNTP